VAEVASTLNENLLFHRMLDDAKDDDTRLFLLGSYLDGLRTTLFRQTLFAEFELKLHELAEKGEPVSGDALNGVYLGLLKQYYGHDANVVHIDDLYSVEWAYIPHFYYNFYVYQYATSLVAATSLANGIADERAGSNASTVRRDLYLGLLSAGSSKEPIQLLRDAGVDMTTPAPFAAAMKEMNAVMDQIEAILAKQ
jgi:oligoendopeptidase F